MEKSALTAILQNATDGILNIDIIGIIGSINPATCRIFGYTAKEIIGKNITMLMPCPKDEQCMDYKQIYQLAWLPNIIGIPFEIMGITKDKSIIPLRLTINNTQCCGRNGYTLFVHQVKELAKQGNTIETK